MLNQDWCLLIEAWKRKGLGDSGLTLPFLIGALSYRREIIQIGSQRVQSILDQMIAEPPDGFFTLIAWCPHISAPTLNLRPHNELIYHSSAPTLISAQRQQTSFVFGSNLVNKWDIRDANALRQQLEFDTITAISHGGFSRKPRKGHFGEHEYQAFDSDDIAFIEEVLQPGITTQ